MNIEQKLTSFYNMLGVKHSFDEHIGDVCAETRLICPDKALYGGRSKITLK